MFIYGIYRLDHMRLRIKLFQFLTSVMDIQEDTVQDSFLKRRKNSANFNTEKTLTKSFKNILQRMMLKQMKKERLFLNHRISKGASQHER